MTCRTPGDPDETPPLPPFPQESEEQISPTLRVGKGGNKRSTTGGRILFYDEASGGTSSDVSRGGSSVQEALSTEGTKEIRRSNISNSPRGISVEEVVLREAREDVTGAWAGVHCETDLLMTLMMLLLWEQVFDPTVEAAGAHCLTVRLQ